MPNILEVLVSNLGPHTSCADHLLAVILRSFGKIPPQHLKLCHYKFHILPSSSLTDPIIGRFLFESLKTPFNKPHTKLSLPTPRRHMRPYLGTRRKWSASRLGRLIPGKNLPRSLSGCFGEEKYHLSLPGIDPRFLGRPVRVTEVLLDG